MVLYYSATGNTEFIAKQIAKRLDDEALDLLARIRQKDHSPIRSNKPFVICSPIHVCEMPRFLYEYLSKTPLAGNRSLYFVFTSGGYTGIAAAMGRKMASDKGLVYRGRAEFTMPRNYPVSRHYPLHSPEKNVMIIEKAYEQIPEVADLIRKGERLKARRITWFEKIITFPFNPVWTRFRHTSEPFHSTNACIGCGKCASLCPLNNIRMKDGRPEWITNCAHCMACISGCPVEAIEYGDITAGQYKYRFDKFGKKYSKL